MFTAMWLGHMVVLFAVFVFRFVPQQAALPIGVGAILVWSAVCLGGYQLARSRRRKAPR